MKKTTKSLLVTALILFCAGLLLALSASLFVKIKGIDPFGVEQKTKVIEDKKISLTEILAASPDSNFMKKLSKREFLRVDLTSFAGEIEVIKGSEISLEFKEANTSNLSYQIIGETLHIKEVDPVGFMGLYIDENGFSFKGLRQLFGPGNSANSGKRIILTLPEDYIIDKIDIKNTVGDIYLGFIQAKEINIDSYCGQVILEGLANDDSRINVKGNATGVTARGCKYNSLNVSTKIGSLFVHVPSEKNASTILDSWIGSVTARCDVPTKAYKLSLSTYLGAVTRNGKTCGKSLTTAADSSARISSTLFVGNIDLSFTGGDEDLTVPVGSESADGNEADLPVQEEVVNPEELVIFES